MNVVSHEINMLQSSPLTATKISWSKTCVSPGHLRGSGQGKQTSNTMGDLIVLIEACK